MDKITAMKEGRNFLF